MVFHTETSQGQGCSPYIQSVSGADAGPNASDGHNAGGFEFHTRSGGAGTDNNAMRIRDDGTVEKYGSVGQILLNPSGAEIEFTRAASSNITCSNSQGYLNIFTGGITDFPAIRVQRATSVQGGARIGINTDTTSTDAQMHVISQPGQPGVYSSYGVRILPNAASDNRITGAAGIYSIHTTIPANNTWTQVAIGRYMGGMVIVRVGDVVSKRTIFANFDWTQPAYGVSHFNEIANNGGWNSGSGGLQITSASGSNADYAFQVRHNSYYNTSNTSSVYIQVHVT